MNQNYFSTKMSFYIICFFVVLATSLALNDWPIIGVFTQPSTSSQGNCQGNCLYLAASYVKYLESAGARIVPINYYSTKEQLGEIFQSINGLFFPGGSAEFPPSAQYMFDKVVAANDQGDYFPLWGTCLGFEWLLIATTRNTSILDPTNGQMDAYNYSIPLNLTTQASSSRLFSSAPPMIMKSLTSLPVTMNNHHYGIWVDHFKQLPLLTDFFDLLSTNLDRQGGEFVSTIEAKKRPIYGSQWHPEKNPFEWGKTNNIPNEAINHSPESILVAQYTASFFVQEARKNTHSFSTWEKEDGSLIENYPPTKTTGSFMQNYYFEKGFLTIPSSLTSSN